VFWCTSGGEDQLLICFLNYSIADRIQLHMTKGFDLLFICCILLYSFPVNIAIHRLNCFMLLESIHH
jgi:hypothetical protein